MEIQGKVIAVLPERSGISQRGEWRSQTYVIETQEQYPKKMAFDVFGGDRIVNNGLFPNGMTKRPTYCFERYSDF